MIEVNKRSYVVELDESPVRGGLLGGRQRTNTGRLQSGAMLGERFRSRGRSKRKRYPVGKMTKKAICL